MDYLFLALESPLFPGALLALFFAFAARALTIEPEVAIETTHPLRPAAVRVAPAQVEPTPSPERPATTFNFDLIAQEDDAELVSEIAGYDCADASSEGATPIRWL